MVGACVCIRASIQNFIDWLIKILIAFAGIADGTTSFAALELCSRRDIMQKSKFHCVVEPYSGIDIIA